MIKNPNSAEFKQIVKHVRTLDKNNSQSTAQVNPLDVVYHRGTPQNRVIVNDDSINENQYAVTDSIKQYMGG